MKIVTTFFFLLVLAFPCAAQQLCGLPGSPSLLGLKLNMSPEQAQGVLGKDLKIKFKTRDEKTIFQNYIKNPAPASLTGVKALYLRFFDQRLYQIEIFYEERNGVKTLKEFTDLMSANLNLPVSAWQDVKGKAVIDCSEYTLIADKILNPRLELTDEQLRARVETVRIEKKK
jgi:hypothetical protein